MKSIFFARHAKSSWDNININDHDRDLKNRGKRDSAFMSQKLLELDWIPDLIISSTALRAKKTAEQIANILKVKNLTPEPDLYLAPPHVFINIVNGLDKQFNSVMLVAHNPALTDLINSYSTESIFNVPTAAIFKVDFDVNKWEDITFENGKLSGFIYPKKYMNEK